MIRASRSIAAMAVLLLFTTVLHAQDSIPWAANISTAQDAAAQQNRLVLLHFWAPNCGPCVQLEQNVFSQPQVGQAVAVNYVPVKINASEFPATARQYDVRSWPQDVVITPGGQVVHRMISPQDSRTYLDSLEQVAASYHQSNAQLAQTQTTTEASVGGVSQYVAPRPQQPLASTPPTGTQRDSAFGGSSASLPPQGAPPQFSAYPPQQAAVAPGYGNPASRDNLTGTTPNQATASPYGAAPQQTFSAPPQQVAPQQPSFQQQQTQTQPPFQQQPQQQQATSAWQANPYIPQQQPPVAAQGGFSQQPQAPPTGPTPAVVNHQPSPGPNNPPLGLDGCCPVTFAAESRWARGDVRWGAIHRGRTYLFASQAFQQQFLANPDAFAPMLSGNDPVAFVDRGELVDGRLSRGVLYNTQMYLFESEQSLQTFWSNPGRYSDIVVQAMRAASTTR